MCLSKEKGGSGVVATQLLRKRKSEIRRIEFQSQPR
jgi:hypothetical protein